MAQQASFLVHGENKNLWEGGQSVCRLNPHIWSNSACFVEQKPWVLLVAACCRHMFVEQKSGWDPQQLFPPWGEWADLASDDGLEMSVKVHQWITLTRKHATRAVDLWQKGIMQLGRQDDVIQFPHVFIRYQVDRSSVLKYHYTYYNYNINININYNISIQ